MSDSDPPVNPSDDTPVGGPEPASEPTEAMPAQGGPGDETPPQGVPSQADEGPAPAAAEPTMVIPAQGASAAASAAAATPQSTEYVLDGDGEDLPWYKRPAYLVMVLVAVLLAALLIAWLLFAGGDDEPDEDEVSLRLEVVDDLGEPLDRPFVAEVTGPPGAEASFVWLQPTSNGTIAGGETGSSGQIDFRWQPDDTVADPASWESTIGLTEEVPPGWSTPASSIDCDLERASRSDAVVTMNVAANTDDLSVDRLIFYTFPNQTFVPGDSITCRIVNTAPVVATTTTTVEETTTSVEETTTTAAPTTAAPTTAAPTTAAPTTAAPTTAAPTTAAPTTTEAPTTTTTVPVPPDTVLTVIRATPGLSRLNDLITLAGLETLFADETETLTVFAPDNGAIDAAEADPNGPDLTDSAAVRSLLLAHVHQGDAWTLADLEQLQEVPVVNGQPQPIDNQVSPPLVGSVGAQITDPDLVESNGVVHAINTMLVIE